jgi:hypothetical protein
MEILAQVGTDECKWGRVAVNEAEQKGVQAINVYACNSGLITFVIDSDLHWFVYHEQEATDRKGGVEEEYRNWAEKIPENTWGKYTYTEFGTSTELQKKIKDGEAPKSKALQKKRYGEGRRVINALNGRTMTITYSLSCQNSHNVLVDGKQWAEFWDSIKKSTEPKEKNKQGSNCCNIF